MGLLSALGGLFQSDEDRASGNLNGLQRFGMSLNDNNAPIEQNALAQIANGLPSPAPNDAAGISLYKAAKIDPKSYLQAYAAHLQDYQSNPMNYGLSTGAQSPVLPPSNAGTGAPGASPQGGVLATPPGLTTQNQGDDGKNYDYLNSNVPPVYRNIVKGMVEGQEVPVTLRGDPKLGSALKIWASNFDPSFSDSTYEERNKTLKDYSPGGTQGKASVAGNTALSHLENFVKNVKSQGNSPIQPINWLGSIAGAAVSDPNVIRANSDKGTLASELATFYKGGSPTDAGTKEFLDMLSTTKGDTGTDAMANEVAQLMKGKIKSMRDQYEATMGEGSANKRNIFSADALKVLDNLGVDTSDIIQPNHPAKNTQTAQPAPALPATAAPSANKVINGVTYFQKDGKWYQQ